MNMIPANAHITVMYSPAPRVVHERVLPFSAGVTVMQALQQSGLLTDCPEIDLSQPDAFAVSIWGKKTSPDHVLRALDRLEICRPLTVDPKVARRERFQKQGSSRAGLFSKRRAGAKPGY
jgi:putative ubiquitin-RnfH superfamily antitoxin RatB of RatAB toxin-antitoxin module